MPFQAIEPEPDGWTDLQSFAGFWARHSGKNLCHGSYTEERRAW